MVNADSSSYFFCKECVLSNLKFILWNINTIEWIDNIFKIINCNALLARHMRILPIIIDLLLRSSDGLRRMASDVSLASKPRVTQAKQIDRILPKSRRVTTHFNFANGLVTKRRKYCSCWQPMNLSEGHKLQW